MPWSLEGGELSPPTCGTTLLAPGRQPQVQCEGSCLELSLCQRNVGGKYLVWRHLRGKFIGLEFHAHVPSPSGPCSLPARCPGAAPLVAGLYGALKLWGLHRLTSEDPFRPQPSCDSVTEAARNAPVTHPAGSGPGEATACAHPLMARSLEPPTAASTNQVSGAVSRRDHLQQPGLQGEGRQAVAFLPC